MNDVMYTIAEVVKEASALQRRGMDIHEALVKAASDRGLNMEQTRRAVESLNTLNTLEQFRAGEKTAEFPVADGRDVVRKLFGKAAAQLAPTPPTPLEYFVEASTQPPIAFQDQLMLKRAHQILDGDAQRAEREMRQYTRDPRELAQMVEAGIRSLEKQAATLEAHAAGAQDRFLQTMGELASSFQVQGAMSFFEFAKEASSFYGNEVRDHLNVLSKMIPRKFHGDPQELQKRAAYIDDRAPQHQLIKRALDAEKMFAKLSQDARPVRSEAAGLKEALRGAFFKQGAPKPKGDSRPAVRERYSPEERANLYDLAQTDVQAFANPSRAPRRGAAGPVQPAGVRLEGKTEDVSRALGRRNLFAPDTEAETAADAAVVAAGQAASAKAQREQALAPRREALEDRKLKLEEAKYSPARKLESGARQSLDAASTVGTAFGAVYDNVVGRGVTGLQMLGPMLKKDKNYGYYDQLADSLRMQSAVQQVLDEDPILRERNPKELMPIIQTLVQVAPEIVSHPPTLASLLRQATSGQFETLDPLTLSQLAEAQTKLWKNREIYKRQIRGDELGMRI